MSKKAYLITRSVVALAAFAVFFWLLLVPPTITSGGENEYSSCHPVGWNFSGDIDPLLNDSFDVENPSEVQRYVDDATSAKYEIETHPKITRDIQRLCHEARLERSVLIVSSLIVFAVVFLSIPKPKPSSGKEPSSDNGSLRDNGSSGESKSVSGNGSSGDGGPSNGIESSNGKSKSGKAESELLCDEPKPGTIQA